MNKISENISSICVDNLDSQNYIVKVNNETINIYQNCTIIDNNCKIIEFTFRLINPTRFNVNILIPIDVQNGCMTLNDSLLLRLFSDYLPNNHSTPYTITCQSNDEHETFSTLCPGKYQNVNFKWYDSDKLKIYLYY